MIGLLFALSVEPAPVCPQIERRAVATYAEVPELIRRFEGDMADPGQDWNSSDVIRRGDNRRGRRLVAAGDMGDGRWLLVSERGGRGVIREIDVWRIAPNGGLEHPVSLSGGALEQLCERAAEQLSR